MQLVLVIGLIVVLLLVDYASDRGWVHASLCRACVLLGALPNSHGSFRLDGHLVVITGAAGGLGRALALEFAQRGASLSLWDVREAALMELVEWLQSVHGVPKGTVHARVVDVSDPTAVNAAAQEQLVEHGPARVVVSNAAVVHGDRLLDASQERLLTSFGVNALASLWLARAFMPQITARTDSALQTASTAETSDCTLGGGNYATESAPDREPDAVPSHGVFVTVGSLMAALPAARLGDYCASKAAVSQLHECLRWELQGYQQAHAPRVACLHVQPYLLDTPLFAGGRVGRYVPAERQRQMPDATSSTAHPDVELRPHRRPGTHGLGGFHYCLRSLLR